MKETIAVFQSAKSLATATDGLHERRLDHAGIGLSAGEKAVNQKLGDCSMQNRRFQPIRDAQSSKDANRG